MTSTQPCVSQELQTKWERPFWLFREREHTILYIPSSLKKQKHLLFLYVWLNLSIKQYVNMSSLEVTLAGSAAEARVCTGMNHSRQRWFYTMFHSASSE